VSVASSPTGAGDAQVSLAKVLGHLNADLVGAHARVFPSRAAMWGDDGMIADTGVRERIVGVLTTLARYVRYRSTDWSPLRRTSYSCGPATGEPLFRLALEDCDQVDRRDASRRQVAGNPPPPSTVANQERDCTVAGGSLAFYAQKPVLAA